MSLAWVLRATKAGQPTMELKVNRVRRSVKRTPRSLTMVSPTGQVNDSISSDFGSHERVIQLDGLEPLPKGPDGRKAIYARMEQWEANFKNWWRASYGPALLDWRQTDAATTTYSGMWAQQRFRLLPATMSFEFMQEFRPGTSFAMNADVAPAAAPGALAASEIFRLTNNAGGILNINAMRVEEAMVGELRTYSPKVAKGGGSTPAPINTQAGRIYTVYVIQGFVSQATIEADMKTIEDAVVDWWRNSPITFYFGHRPGVQVVLENMTANREATAPGGKWEVVIEMRKSAVWP